MSTEYEMDGVTITLEAGERLKLGDSLTYRARPPWWRRAMEWIAVRIFRRPRYDSVITHVDRERGIITVDKGPDESWSVMGTYPTTWMSGATPRARGGKT